MWESQRDFQRVWEGWKAGFMAFHAFHTLSFPWPVFARQVRGRPKCCHASEGVTVARYSSQVDECIGDLPPIEIGDADYFRVANHSPNDQPILVAAWIYIQQMRD